MTTISELEFARICDRIRADRESILKHNPIGTADETLLWLLVGALVSYLSLTEMETPCFTGRPDAATYREAVKFMLKDKMADEFDAEVHLDRMLAP